MIVTHKYGVWVVVSGLVLAIVISPATGQFEDLQGCVSNCRFIPLLTGCLAEKFLIMLNLPPLSTECPSATNGATFDSQGEYPTHHAGVKVASTTLRSGYLDDVALRHAQKKQQSTLSDQTFHFIENLLSKTSSVQTDTPLLDTYLRSRSIPSLESILIETIEPLRGEAGRFKNTLIQAQAAMMALSSEEIQKGSASPQRGLVTTLEELQRIVSCLRAGYDEEDYEDGLTWTKCLFTCSDLPLIGTCMADAFAQIGECNRTLWLKDLIIRVLTDFLDLDCYFKITKPTAENLPLTLEEGGEPVTVEFITYQPPGVYCWPANPLSDLGGVARGVISNVFKLNPPCSVEIQLTTSNYMYDTLPYVRTELLPGIDMGRPKCRNGSAINQVAIGWHPAAEASSGIIQLSEQNWNQTFRIPLSAVIDYKMEDDAYLNVSFTMKMVVDNNIFNTTKIEMNVFDNDPVNISTCTSFNDPHIVTFDGAYYNNFYHGYFQMYKHNSLPYEVQVAYQACDGKTNESCTCAVAVRSGDDVFVVDRCRQKDCVSPDCTVIQKITLYQNKELTPGTDIYKLDGGLSYMVSLPHGTLVKIVNNREMLNVYITPSPFDRRNTLGLCGTFNEHREDDFTLSDGSTVADSVTTFVESWRLNFNETIFDGALENETQFNNGNFCQCAHYLIGYAQCNCGYSTLRQTCDLDLDNKFSAENITSIVRRSEKQSLVESEDTRDMDFNYVPNLPSFADNTLWPEQRSFDYCITNTHMKGKNLIQECKDPKTNNNEFLAPVKNAFQGCMDDIDILDEANEVWKLSFLEMMKYGCLERVYRASGREARNWMKYVNETCINDCSQAGVCVYGVCQCNGDMAGPDCSISASQPPQVIMTATSLCDTRYQNCSYSTVYGQYFTDDKRITCRATPKQVISTERLPSTKTVDVGIVLLSNDQIACVLPRSGSFSVQVLWNGSPVVMQSSAEVRATSPFLFKSYDSACYVCPPGQEMCSEKKDGTYCLIGNTCYASLQSNPSNDCQICNLTYSQSSFYYKTDQRCTERRLQEEKAKADEKRDKDIRIGVSVGLSCLVVLITIIMLMCGRRSDDNKSDTISSHSSSISSTNNISKQFNGMTPDEIAPPLEQKAKEAAVSSSIPTINISDDSGTQSLKLRDSNQSSASDTHDHVDGSNDSSAQSINSTAALVSGPGNNVISTTAEVTDVKLEQKLEANGKPVHPRVLLIGEDNLQYGSMKSLSKVAMVRERKDSLSSVKSVGIGGGPPIQYGLNRHSFNSSGVNVSNVKL